MPPTQPTLRDIQAPLKAQYKDDPASALITLKSHGTLDNNTITCKLSSSSSPALQSAHRIAGLHAKAGGGDISAGELCSGDMLLDALVACAGVTLKAVATALGLPLLSGVVSAEGDMDFRGTLGVDRGAPVGMTAIRLGFELVFGAGEVGEGDVERLGRLTERYCVVLQTIARKPEVSVRVVGRGGVGGVEEGVDRSVVWGTKV
ncbi:hypothetical protein EJ05DRAFT_327839 [Pseudovirgaria hyperparasitica]|uniref:OsmC family protein-like protein n=1 Tax=Pseudovirgaria hyperparasitica TaxID=470096 RepID=A0A6A6WAB2_9PEZI|nr:uncharacterized protein EJ05DRAFT_327839 [Pseudovirgaria hyperparasitica]KAF2758974.1 hypothetical protein EJ05DRAFT_327839 [Pseudovirgaria hyperparasitica]